MEAREKEKLYQLDIEKEKLKKEENIEKEKLELEKIKIEKAQASPTVTETSTGKVQVKLPKLTFPKFYGNILKWSEFWDSFRSAVDQNMGLNAVDKLNYLRRQLEGEAYGCIAGLERTEANYSVAITLLQKRYGDSQIIINAHYKELMESPNQTSKLRQTFDTIERHLRSLQVLGEDINHKHFVSMIQAKLPKPVKLQLQLHKSLKKYGQLNYYEKNCNITLLIGKWLNSSTTRMISVPKTRCLFWNHPESQLLKPYLPMSPEYQQALSIRNVVFAEAITGQMNAEPIQLLRNESKLYEEVAIDA